MRKISLTILLLLVTMTATTQTYLYTGPSGDKQAIDISVVGDTPPANYYRLFGYAERRQRWPKGLQMRLDSLLTDDMFISSQVALTVYDLTDDMPLYRHNERQTMPPASTLKLLTAITALNMLGSGYCYHTTLYLDGDITGGTLNGDIYCVGGFDPMIDSDDMRRIARDMANKGIREIRGRIITDKSMKDSKEKYGAGWCWDDKNPILSPLLVNRKDAFADELLKALRKEKINVRATVHGGTLPHDGLPILSIIERPLVDVLTDMMKNSNNLYAESMLYQIAAADGTRPARAKDAATHISHLIDSIMPYHTTYSIADGSGLSLYNYVTADTETMLLRYAYNNPHIYDILLPALPIAGVDGTLKHRMTTSRASGNVCAKTGTLTGTSSLAGYLTTSNSHTLCFVIINQGVMNSRKARDFQDKVCDIMCDKYVDI